MTENGATDLRQRIRASVPKGEQITVKEWDNVTLELRSMTVAEKASLAIDDENLKTDEAMMYLPRVIVFTACNPETGEKLFTDDDLEWLKDEPAGIIERLALEGFRVAANADQAERSLPAGEPGTLRQRCTSRVGMPIWAATSSQVFAAALPMFGLRQFVVSG